MRVLRSPVLDTSGMFGRKSSRGALTGNATERIGIFTSEGRSESALVRRKGHSFSREGLSQQEISPLAHSSLGRNDRVGQGFHSNARKRRDLRVHRTCRLRTMFGTQGRIGKHALKSKFTRTLEIGRTYMSTGRAVFEDFAISSPRHERVLRSQRSSKGALTGNGVVRIGMITSRLRL